MSLNALSQMYTHTCQHKIKFHPCSKNSEIGKFSPDKLCFDMKKRCQYSAMEHEYQKIKR